MKFLVLLLALALRRRDGGWPAWLSRDDRHRRLLASLSPGTGTLAWWLAVALPALLVALLFGWFDGALGALATLVLGTVLVLWMVGVESEFRSLDPLLVRGRMNDREALARGADDAFGLAAGECDAAWFADLERCVLRRAALLFAVVFWVTVLGFGAALLLVLNRAWLARNPDGGDWARSLDAALCWIPARLTTLALALVGHFGAVIDAAGGRLWRLDDGGALLAAVAEAGLERETAPDEDRFQHGVDRLEALQGLLLRALAVWLILSALWTLLAA